MNSKSFVALLLMSFAAFSQAFVVISPNGGGTYSAGQSVPFTWTPSSVFSSVTIQYSLDNGASWNTLTNWAQASAGSYPWNVPFIKKQTTQALVRVIANGVSNPPSDVSDAPFTIQAASPDAYEPNNDAAHAYLIMLGDSAVKNAFVIGGDSMQADTSVGDVDWFKVTLAAGKLVTVSSFPCLSNDTGSGYGDQVPYVQLNNPSNTPVATGNGSFTYNVSQAGVYYLRVWTNPGSWSKYGLSVKTVAILSMQTADVDSSHFTKVTDSSGTRYTVGISNDTTKLNLTLTLTSKVGGSITTAVLAAGDLASAPGKGTNVKAISITADPAITSSIKTADITIPYSASDLNGAPESSLVVLWLNDSTSQWSPISFSVDTVNHIIIAHTSHFSVFGVFAGSSPTFAAAAARIPRAFGVRATFLRNRQSIDVCYSLPTAQRADIRLYSAKGVCVKRTTRYAASSIERVAWNCGDLGAGFYIVDFRAGMYRMTAKITVVR